MSNALDNINVIMVEPKNPGNIGSAVRAMKNMGISHLRLVNPPEGFKDNTEQKMFGYRAQEITQKSKIYSNVPAAVKDISLSFLATCKGGKWKRDFFSPEQAAEIIAQRAHKEKIAVIFGREESGVTIDESQMSNYYIQIPMAGTYPSLNLSQAVLVILYEIYKKVGNIPTLPHPKTAPKRDFERLHDNMWRLMKSLIIREPEKGLFHRSLKRALNRTRWTKSDIAVFDRFCKQIRWFINNKSKEEFIE